MEQYILQLIKNNNRLILPGLGAFIMVKENDQTVLFNSFLTFNDGLMANHISEQEKISTEMANDKIAKYVENIKDELSSKGHYTIPGFGTLTSTDGNIAFEYNSNPVSESIKKDSIADDSNNDLLNIDTSAQIITSDSNDHIVTEPEATSSIQNDPLIELQSADQSATKKDKKTNKPEPKVMTKQKDNKKRGVWILLAFIILLVAGIGFYFLKNKQQAAPLQELPEPGLIVDTTSVEPVIEEPVAEPKPKHIEAAKAFHIIVGSYKSTAAAEKRVQKLKDAGYTNATYFTRGDWYVVSIDALPNQIEAERVQEEILDRDRIESWIVNHQ
jgi:cell division septation protein DedD